MSQPTGFVPAIYVDDRPIGMNGQDQLAPCWAQIGPGGASQEAGLPAQAQVAAWARHPL
jgi:hypothetical protein